MSREAHIPLALWIPAALVAHLREARQLLKNAELRIERLVTAIAPTLQRYLTGSID
jgi:hypothetical protein